ncbi:MAG: ATP-binding cassette domain-containing protein [Chitinivibrionales bacterium]|nr:ATP-binding cassette domain-containing protein [Chitinivibrionales bacterium]
MSDRPAVISGRNLSCLFGSGKKKFHAVKRVSFDIHDQEIISIVGESGSGKTTLARMILLLQPISEGTLLINNQHPLHPKKHWQYVQAVFQDPFASFNQFFTIKNQLLSAFKLKESKIDQKDKQARIEAALLQVNMSPEKILEKYPFELSGGQMQRLLIARIFLIRPRILIADEPTSMVDACSRATILDMLLDLKRKLHMTIIFITHDIGLAYYVSDRIFVMRNGSIVEQGGPNQVILHPAHSYTQRLLQDIPVLNRAWLQN